MKNKKEVIVFTASLASIWKESAKNTKIRRTPAFGIAHVKWEIYTNLRFLKTFTHLSVQVGTSEELVG